MKLNQVLLLIAVVVVGTGCDKAEVPPASEPAAHAPSSAVPGSHEDWCDEHEVPESMCTRWNSSLIAAFKATNDWCGEHGLPESQCLKCNPDLKILRPPKGQ